MFHSAKAALLASLIVIAQPALSSATLAQSGTPPPNETANCSFVLGFATLDGLISRQVGGCLDNQASASNGDALQHTSAGLMVWRKTDNWTAFTDGFRTWIDGPQGLQERLNSQRFSWEPVQAQDALATLLSMEDVQKLLPADQQWWPDIPTIGAPPFNGDPQTQSMAYRLFVSSPFERLGSTSGRVGSNLWVFADAASAHTAFANLPTQLDKGRTIVPGPAVGDEQRYTTLTKTDSDNKKTPEWSTVRFRIGTMIASVFVFSPSPAGFTPSSDLARFARVFAAKINSLQSGQLTASAIPDELTALMPASAPAAVSPVLVTAALPDESWAVTDNIGDQAKALNTLQAGGVKQLGFREYALSTDHDQVVQVVLFTFDNPQSASAFQAVEVAPNVASGAKLDAGNTGQLTSYTNHDNFDELMFAKGRVVADVACTAPYGKVSTACEGPTRQLAESWYAGLPS